MYTSDELFWLLLWAIIGSLVTSIFICGIYTSHLNTQAYIKNNYQQVTVVGNDQYRWQKVETDAIPTR